MKKLIKVALASTVLATGAWMSSAQADDVKLGVIFGFTGPIESLTPTMAQAVDLAAKEASDSGNLLGGKKVVAVRGDSTCIDAAAATAAAERLVTSDNVAAIVGADCSGVTTAVANNVAVPNGVAMISPSATSPALTSIDDKGYFFRVAPSDARQGQVLANILMGQGVKDVAVTYTNNDYGKGLAESFGSAFAAAGGKVVISASHEDGKADYSAEVGALSAAGSKNLMLFGYVDQGGKGIMQTAIDLGAFDRFFGADGMVGDSLIQALGKDAEGLVTTIPGGGAGGADKFQELAKAAGFPGTGPYNGEAYDAASILILAIQAAGSTDRAAIQANILKVANAPGEKIMPGELGKALKIIADGGDVDFVGATAVEFTDIGETNGSYKEQIVEGGKQKLVKVHQ
ncbi:MAG: ABC transporter substrate-binding protein [Pseudomonadota bacterium]